jgi:predicted phosphodiesterase
MIIGVISDTHGMLRPEAAAVLRGSDRLDPAAGDFRVVVSGHSHRPSQETRDGVLWFNPGSAGPRRFQLPVAVGRLTIADGIVRGELVTIG